MEPGARLFFFPERHMPKSKAPSKSKLAVIPNPKSDPTFVAYCKMMDASHRCDVCMEMEKAARRHHEEWVAKADTAHILFHLADTVGDLMDPEKRKSFFDHENEAHDAFRVAADVEREALKVLRRAEQQLDAANKAYETAEAEYDRLEQAKASALKVQ
jgi:hypothetical protein